MIRPGQVILFPFPQVDLAQGKLRPALVLGRLPGSFEDWLICMISTQARHYVEGFDEIVSSEDADFASSGLKVKSVFRVGRLAVVEGEGLMGAIGEIDAERLQSIKSKLAAWLHGG